MPPSIATNLQHTIDNNNLNINLPENNAVLRLEVELRDKNARRRPQNYHQKGFGAERNRQLDATNKTVLPAQPPNPNNYFVPMEKVSIF